MADAADTGQDLRDAFIDELISLAAAEQRIVVLDADVSRTSRTRRFRDAYPDRFFDMGVAEQDMTGAAAGLAAVGRIPVSVTFAVFATLRAAEPLRTSICYPQLNAKVVGGYAGLSNSRDGATHHSIEDVAISRAYPNLVVLSPSDPVVTRKVVQAAIAHQGPVYIRLEYETMPVIHDPATTFRIGQGMRLRQGDDATIVSYGTAVHRALTAAGELAAEGIGCEVLEMACLKPLDTTLLAASAARTGVVVTLEDHNVEGGLGSAVARTLLEAGQAPAFRALGISDTFTESAARPDELRARYGTSAGHVVAAVRALVAGSSAGAEA